MSSLASLNPLCQVLHDATVIRDWQPPTWNRFLTLARHARLLGRCLFLFEQQGLTGQVPHRILDQLRGALVQTRYIQSQARRELSRIKRVLDRESIPLMVLKGGAYLVAGLPPADWRNLSDIDVMVPVGQIDRVEAVLKRAGWRPSGDFDDYDEHYYHDWMHEVPPLSHPAREFEVDVHHNLAPPVSRVRIDADRLWDQAVSLEPACPGAPLMVLGPADMLIHNAVHLYMNDELRGGLRDVVDFRDLLNHFRDADAAFERQLLDRATAMDCGRVMYYAVDTAVRLTGLQVSAGLADGLARFAPAAPVRGLMRRLIDRVLAPAVLGGRLNGVAGELLFIRSHWVRMPPAMLLRHLLHKALRRDKPATHDDELPG